MVKNVYTSVLFAAVVLVGIVPPGQMTDTGQVILLPGVASFLNINVNATACDGTLVIVNTAFEFKVAVIKLPFARLMLEFTEVFPNALIYSLAAIALNFNALPLGLIVFVVPFMFIAIFLIIYEISYYLKALSVLLL